MTILLRLQKNHSKCARANTCVGEQLPWAAVAKGRKVAGGYGGCRGGVRLLRAGKEKGGWRQMGAKGGWDARDEGVWLMSPVHRRVTHADACHCDDSRLKRCPEFAF